MDKNMYDVGIVGWWYNLNYGGTLTYYSLNKYLESLGLSVLMIQRSDSDVVNNARDTVPMRFSLKHYNISKPLAFNDMNKLNDCCQAFIIGSDQLWNPKLMAYSGRQYFLSYVNDNRTKIAYSTSLGDVEKIDNDFAQKYKKYLQRLDYISVREDFAVEVLERDLSIKADCVCDPIFLNGREIFDDLALKAKNKYPNKYVLNFLLDPNQEKINVCKHIRRELNIGEYVNFTNLQKVEENVTKFYGEHVYAEADIEELVCAYKNAEFIVTDSFHGTCLAIIFNKPFISIANMKRGPKRFISLMNALGVLDRLAFNINEIYDQKIYFQKIDYDSVNTKLTYIRRRGQNWLLNALGMRKTVANSKISCSGCSACEAICPTNAITMKNNEEGFLEPHVDNEKCINCGLCLKKCIMLNPKYKNEQEPDCYSVMMDTKTRMKSSSGGAFTAFAEYIIEQGGYVCGAAYTKAFEVEHIIVDNKVELDKLRGSKYMQSNMRNVLHDIKTLLEQNKLVLFTGMPCQVAGLYSYLGKDYENLYSIDILCHGITSAKVFKKYHKEILGNKELIQLEFKAKEPWGWHAGVNAYFSDGSKYSQPLEKDYFFIAYLKSISKNNTCSQCVANKLPRQGDFTIGDFWGIHKCHPDMYDNKGTSVVLVNNDNARNLFERVKNRMWKVEKERLLDAIKGNQPIKSPFKMHKNRNLFFEKFDTFDFKTLTVGCRDDNLFTLQRAKTNVGLSVNEQYLYYLARVAALNSKGRQIVTWTAMPRFNQILKQYYNLDVAFSVAKNPAIIDNKSVYAIEYIREKADEIYLVAIHPSYSKENYNLLEDMGYKVIKDFIFRTPEPIVLENINAESPYEDEYGNVIIAGKQNIGKVIFRGCNNYICIEDDVKGVKNITIDVSSNAYIHIKNNCVINDSVLIEVKGVHGHSRLIIEEKCRISNAFFRLYNHQRGASIEIASRCTFERNLEMHVNQGKRIIIGEDCMFSHDVELWSGDGHTIYDVTTGKNINFNNNIDDVGNEIRIGNHVWVAKGSFIMHGTIVGDGSIIGARSVVKNAFPNNCSIAGNPAKIVRKSIAWGREQIGNNMLDEYADYTQE